MKYEKELEKIYEKLEYLNHCSTRNSDDIAWIKWMIIFIVGLLLTGLVKSFI